MVATDTPGNLARARGADGLEEASVVSERRAAPARSNRTDRSCCRSRLESRCRRGRPRYQVGTVNPGRLWAQNGCPRFVVTIVDVALCYDRHWIGKDCVRLGHWKIASQCAANTERTVSIGITTVRSLTKARLEGTVKAAGVDFITSLRAANRWLCRCLVRPPPCLTQGIESLESLVGKCRNRAIASSTPRRPVRPWSARPALTSN
jgi:hypothetical protein